MSSLNRQRAAGGEGGSRLVADVFTSAAWPMNGPEGASFSPTTATLISGERECVLIDTLIARKDVVALGDAIEKQGTTLTAILITHGHPDHYFGLDRLLKRFPFAQAWAARGVVNYIRKNKDAELGLFKQIMKFDFDGPGKTPEPLTTDVLALDGEELRIVDVGQGDIAPSTVVWIPSLSAVISGDVAYNTMHLMLGLTGPEEWDRWIDSVHMIRALQPRTVITGHKKPEADNDARTVLNGTEQYIRDFADVAERAGTADEIVAVMSKRYPDYPNISILQMSADAAIRQTRG